MTNAAAFPYPPTDFVRTPRQRHLLARYLWSRTGGKGWEPPDPNHPLIVALIHEGFLRRVDGICGFERLKDACVTWTEAGRAACAASGGAG